MSQGLGGPGQLLPPPSFPYPVTIVNAPVVPNTNKNTLAAGQALPIPPSPVGGWVATPAAYGFVQYFDPVTLIWTGFNTSRGYPQRYASDGFNFRIANVTGCPVAAIVTAGGTANSYFQSNTSIAPSVGSSVWQAIVGGAVSTTITSTFNSATAGIGYGIPPIAFIPSPPPPGVPATAVAVLTASTTSVASLTVTNQGAGYPTVPTVLFLPDPFDPNYLNGTYTTAAVATLQLTGAGRLTAALCTNNGWATGATMPSLTVSGSGASATATVVPCWTIASTSVAAAGGGYSVGGAGFVTAGGQAAGTPAWTNPASELTGAIPRQAQAAVVFAGTTLSSITLIDSGLFFGTPTTFLAGGFIATTVSSIVPTMGSANETIVMQPT
jgi:hypothetical protein